MLDGRKLYYIWQDDYDDIEENLAKATKYITQALEMRKILYGINNEDVAVSYINLGKVYNKEAAFISFISTSAGKNREAIQYYKKALEIYKVLYSDNNPNIAYLFNIIGKSYIEMGEVYTFNLNPRQFGEEALYFYNMALEMHRNIDYKDNLDIADSLCNVGLGFGRIASEVIERGQNGMGIVTDIIDNFKGEQLKFRKKEIEYYEESLTMYLTLYSENHPAVAKLLNIIGQFYYNNYYDSLSLNYGGRPNDINKALEYHKQAYSIYATLYGKNTLFIKSIKDSIEYLQPDYFSWLPHNFLDNCLNLGGNTIGAENKKIITKRGKIDSDILDVRFCIQKEILNKVQLLAENGEWSCKKTLFTYDVGDFCIKGYLESSYLKETLDSLRNNKEYIEIAQMLIFEAMNLGIIKSKYKNYDTLKEFIKEYPDLVDKIGEEHPEYFVDGSIACIAATELNYQFDYWI